MARSEVTYRIRTGREVCIQDAHQRIKQQLRASLRRIWSRFSIEREAVLYKARSVSPKLLKNGKIGKKPSIVYLCAHCQNTFPIKEVQVDHITPVGVTPDMYKDWGTWLALLFTDENNLQVLCRPCHVIKTKTDKLNMKDTYLNAG